MAPKQEVLVLLQNLAQDARSVLGDAEGYLSQQGSSRNKCAAAEADAYSSMALELYAAYAAGELDEPGLVQRFTAWTDIKQQQADDLRKRLSWDIFNQNSLSYKLFVLDRTLNK
jgi:hypothetical protein